MSMVELGEVIEDKRAILVLAGIRSYDLDLLLEAHVNHKLCLEQLQAIIDVELARWVNVRGALSEKQWDYFITVDEDNNEMRALKKAAKALKKTFKEKVLVLTKKEKVREQQ